MLKINRILSKKGFSLIELMVAVVILALAVFGIFNAYSVGFMGMADARDITVATNYAREKMEEIKNNSFGEITDEIPVDITGTKFERKVIVDNSITDLKKIITTVSWENRKGETKEVKLEMLVYGYNL